jgi:myo-inositol-1(or 4)-monophosphatase
MQELQTILKKVKKIVLKASKIAVKRDFNVDEKGSEVNVVTTTDLNVQKFLVERLKKIMPQAGFICEEEHLFEGNNEYLWVIDPIDGTFNHVKGIPQVAISVGLVKNKEPVLGVVYNPFSKDMYWALKGFGAYRNGTKIGVSKASFSKGLLCTAMSLYNKTYAKVCSDIIYDAYMQCNDVRRFGTCALELCYMAEGQTDLYFEIRVFPWDYAGAFAILKEAGGVLYALNLQEPTFDCPTPLIGANNMENVLKLNDIVSKYLKEKPYKE